MEMFISYQFLNFYHSELNEGFSRAEYSLWYYSNIKSEDHILMFCAI